MDECTTTVVLPVAVTAEIPTDASGENALAAVVLPVAAANIATALVVSAAVAAVANASDTTTVADQVPKDTGNEDFVDAQFFEAVHNHHPQRPLGQQGALESVMATTKISLERSKCIDSLDQLITRLSTLSDRSSGISPGFDCIDNALPWKQIGVFPQYETLDAINATSGVIPLPSAESAIELFELVKIAWQNRLKYEACDTKEERDSYCCCIGHWRPTQNILKQICNQVLEQLMTREASACLRKQPAITLRWNEGYSPETCPHPDTMECLYIDSTVRLLTNETYLSAYIQAALAATSTSECENDMQSSSFHFFSTAFRTSCFAL